MIHAQELRIGNLVSNNEDTFLVRSLAKDKVELDRWDSSSSMIASDDSVEYIPLSEEWLQLLADSETGNIVISSLERTSDSSDMIVLSTVECYLHEDGFLRVCAYEYDQEPDGSVSISDDVIILGYDHIRFVHQLQNLYFDLTGKELAVPSLPK